MAPPVTAPAQAYALGNCEWDRASNLRWANYSGTSGAYATAMTTAASRWTATSTPVSIYKATSSTATHFQVNTANYGNVTWSGRAPNFDTCSSGYYTRALPLLLNTYHLGKYTATRKAMVAAHELGHNLGLRHIGREGDACSVVALMHPRDADRFRCGVYGPKNDDVRGINAKY